VEEASAEHRSRASFHALLDFLVETVGGLNAILDPPYRAGTFPAS
jgi:hypothetical protein